LIPPATLQKLESLVPGEAQRFLELVREEFRCYLDATRKESERQAREQQHLRLYSILSVILGTFLATASLALCAYAIQRGANLAPLAAVLGPVAGIAGVFIWGYQPRGSSSLNPPKNSSSKALAKVKGKVNWSD
jgi:uncharacterized membrane protein